MKRMILIVTGAAGPQRASRDLLERAGYDVREIVSLDEALGVARRLPPLAVVVQRAETLSGAGRFAERLRGHPLTHDVPVLVLTADAEQAVAPDGGAGVSWLPEHSPPRTLLDEIAYLTRPRRQSERSARLLEPEAH